MLRKMILAVCLQAVLSGAQATPLSPGQMNEAFLKFTIENPLPTAYYLLALSMAGASPSELQLISKDLELKTPSKTHWSLQEGRLLASGQPTGVVFSFDPLVIRSGNHQWAYKQNESIEKNYSRLKQLGPANSLYKELMPAAFAQTAVRFSGLGAPHHRAVAIALAANQTQQGISAQILAAAMSYVVGDNSKATSAAVKDSIRKATKGLSCDAHQLQIDFGQSQLQVAKSFSAGVRLINRKTQRDSGRLIQPELRTLLLQVAQECRPGSDSQQIQKMLIKALDQVPNDKTLEAGKAVVPSSS